MFNYYPPPSCISNLSPDFLSRNTDYEYEYDLFNTIRSLFARDPEIQCTNNINYPLGLTFAILQQLVWFCQIIYFCAQISIK